MKLNISAKRIICFLLAVLMVISVVGCKENKKKKPQKVVIRDKVILREPNNDNSNVDTSKPINKVEDVTTRAKRALLPVPEEDEEKVSFDELHKEEYAPEFEYKNVDFAGNLADYIIVYSNSKDKNGAPTNARVLAEKLATFFKDNDNVTIPVKEEKTVTGNEKMIIVGDTTYYKSNLSEQEFAVNIKGDNIVFEGGHIVMAEKAVDWFRTIKREKGKIATLSGKQDDFASTIKLENYDKELVYVWGDEFDGDELVDRSKWHIGSHMPQWSDLEYLKNDEEVCYVKDGRLRMTVIRKLSEDNPDIGYASCGSYDTEDTLAYRNGYIEFDAKISYTDGIIMPLWLMSNPDGGLIIPKEQYGAAWTLEFDIFETFSNGDTWDVSIHKYYKPYNYNHNGNMITNGIVHTSVDENGNPVELTTFHGDVVYHNVPGEAKPRVDKFRSRILEWGAWGFITSWRPAYTDPNSPYYNPEDNEKQKYKFTGEELEKLNDSYHRYGLLYTKEGYKMYIDGKCWLERDWIYDWDLTDEALAKNNGWGYNLYYYLIMNQHPYTENSGYTPDMWIDAFDTPISSYINSVRIYQLPDSIEIETPAYNE
ncbi:MAG: hypothetical protein IJN56_07205 [Clostridia bacterium]|nr:hypothetical protein [Clostridia bacterium]